MSTWFCYVVRSCQILQIHIKIKSATFSCSKRNHDKILHNIAKKNHVSMSFFVKSNLYFTRFMLFYFDHTRAVYPVYQIFTVFWVSKVNDYSVQTFCKKSVNFNFINTKCKKGVTHKWRDRGEALQKRGIAKKYWFWRKTDQI